MLFFSFFLTESLKQNFKKIKNPKYSTWMQSQKTQNDLCSFPNKPFNITVIQVYALSSNAQEAEVEWFYEDI